MELFREPKVSVNEPHSRKGSLPQDGEGNELNRFPFVPYTKILTSVPSALVLVGLMEWSMLIQPLVPRTQSRYWLKSNWYWWCLIQLVPVLFICLLPAYLSFTTRFPFDFHLTSIWHLPLEPCHHKTMHSHPRVPSNYLCLILYPILWCIFSCSPNILINLNPCLFSPTKIRPTTKIRMGTDITFH